MTRPIIHVLEYGDSGSGKSTAAATFPMPMLVLMWDPLGKDTPYKNRGLVTPTSVNALGVPCCEVVDPKTAELRCRIEYYHDAVPWQPVAYARFIARLPSLVSDIETEGFRSLVCDSITFMELAARKHSQYILMPKAADSRKWFSGSTDALEEAVVIAFGSLPVNVVTIAHVDELRDEVNGAIVRNPAAPGRLLKRMPAAYSELYRAYTKRNDQGAVEYWWQTKNDGVFNASSQVRAPDPCPQHYEAIWASRP